MGDFFQSSAQVHCGCLAAVGGAPGDWVGERVIDFECGRALLEFGQRIFGRAV